ncbi:hypothetical protein Bca4012_083991 [Brassica carinata]|uniref:Uncharacterized protein n=1 Tax=Brassica carinata TaxID=52824 RepID=A0A8X7V9C0_BRACI|nr:hypothetical protein Bca52824_026815 [Brassica carinata]
MLKGKREYWQEMRRIKEQAEIEREYQLVQEAHRRAQHDNLHSQQFQDDLRRNLLQAFQGETDLRGSRRRGIERRRAGGFVVVMVVTGGGGGGGRG